MDLSFFLSGEQGAYEVFDWHLRALAPSQIWPALVVITALLAHAAYTDIFCGRVIRNITTMALFCLALAVAPMIAADPGEHFLWVAGGLVALAVVYFIGAMKEGDIKLYAGLLVLLGPAFFFLVLISWILIIIYAIPTMVRARRQKISERGKRLGSVAGGPGIALAFPLALAGYGLPPLWAAAMIAGMGALIALYWGNARLEERYEAEQAAAAEAPGESPDED